MKRIRVLHLWLGMFLAPSILLFAFTGALQVFGLHEDGAPAVIEKLARIHMKQSIDSPPPRPARAPAPERASEPRPSERAASPAARAPRPQMHSSTALKWFFAFVSIGLIVSTLLGIYMAIKYRRDRRVVFGLLAAGCVIPTVMLLV